MQKDKIWAIAVIATLVLTIAINYLVGGSSVIGPSNAEISAKYTTLLTPAGFAFSIWGIIYFGLGAFSIYQVLPSQQANPRFRRIRHLVVLNLLLNCAWLFLFTFEEMALSLLVMAGLLLTLILIHDRLRIGREKVPTWERLTARISFSLYFGWVTVATILNASIFLLYTGWDGGEVRPAVWALVLLGAGLFIGMVVFKRYGNWVYLLPIAWAFMAIAQKQEATPLVAGGAALASWAAVVLINLRYIPAVRPDVYEKQ